MIEEKEDFFEQTPEDRPEKVREPKRPRYRHDDPRYYDREEGRWDHLKPSPYSRGPILWIVGAAVVVLCIFLGLYAYIFSPHVQEATQWGYVEDMRKEGTMFQTFEGVLIPYKEIMDTTRTYDGDFTFSAKNDSVAADLLRVQKTGIPVKVSYQVYRFALPWKGKNKVVVTEVDTTTTPTRLIPADRRPQYQGLPQ